MSERRGGSFDDVATVRLTSLGETTAGLERVQASLVHYGYLEKESFAPARLDPPTSSALERYQQFFGLTVSGEFDRETQQQMTKPRCGMPDGLASDRLRRDEASEVTCEWSKRNLTYALARGTEDAVSEFTAVERAMATWATVVPLTFTRVNGATNTTADIKISWVNRSHEEDALPGNTIELTLPENAVAHADEPPDCSDFLPQARVGLPRPLHFNDETFEFSTGAVIEPDEFDVESVALHELGHLIGLAHVNRDLAVMFPVLPSGTFKRVLTARDISNARSLYPS